MYSRTFSFIFIFLVLITSEKSYAACGGTVRTWNGSSTTAWATAANWTAANAPDTATEDALIVSATRIPRVAANTSVGCVEVQSGQLQATAARTLTVTGTYFRSLTITGVNITSTGFIFDMAGTSAQTFENLDQIPQLRISNNTSVTLTQPFIIDTNFSITGTTSTVYVDADLVLLAGIANLTIPSGTTLQIRSGATLTANTNITVNGSLILDSGTTLILGNGNTLSVGASGNIQLNGADGSVAKITSTGSGSTYTFNMAGLMSANYFRIDRMVAAGLNVTGTLQSISNGEFHYIANAGNAITLGAASAIPTTMSGLSFYDDSAFGNVKNINATAYVGAVSTLSNWSGGVGGAVYETDPGNKLTWGTQAPTALTLSNATAAGSPAATIAQNSGDVLFATYAFSLNQNDTLTDITSVKVTMTGTGSSSDVSTVKLYKDVGGGTNCVYDNGVDTQIGSTLSMSGSPPSATFSIGAGDIQTNGPGAIACIHLRAATTTTAEDNQSLKFAISNTSDVVNSQNYSFSSSSGPPASGGTSVITGDVLRVWQGDASNAYNTTGNWTGNAVPTATTDCRIGVGTNITLFNVATGNCQNATFQSGGTFNFNNTTNNFRAYAKLLIQSGFNFTNAASGNITMIGAGNQILNMNSTTFPGNVNIANTGIAPNNVVTVETSGTITGNLTVTTGKLSVANGVTLSVGGNITVLSPATLEVLPGGTLALGNGRTLTVNSGGFLKLVGASGQNATLTSTSGAAAYSVIINGEIQAQYYTIDHLDTAGFSVEAGATINGSYYFQNGNFNYPVNNNTTMLKLKRQVPGNTITNISFNLNGSTATNTVNIDTTGAAAGTLTVSTYSGDLGGPSFDVNPAYLINWSGATNTITINQDQTGPASVDAGATYVMGRFGFTQTLADISYVDTNLTSLKLTLTGDGTSGDVSALRIYKDTNCDSAGGTLIGSGVFSGSPASKTFAITAGDFVIVADPITPPKNCIYVEYDIANAATNGKTVGVKIDASTDQVNSQIYLSSGSVNFPVTLGTAATINGAANTTWTGTTSANWFTSTNWTSGVPDSTKNCTINNVTNDPSISGATATCKNVTIGDGIVTLVNATGARLDVYGSYTNTGTVNQNDAILRMIDGGAATSQSLTSSSTITNFEIEKTGGGTVSIAGASVTINSLTYKPGNTGILSVSNSKTLILPNGVSIPNGTMDIVGGATLKIGNGSSITLNGGTFKTSGTHDQYPQNLSAKGKITVNGAGTWGFTATSGTLSLVGFVIDYIDTNGLNVGGTTNFTNFRGGHFTNLSQSYASVKVMQLNTVSVPASPADVEWYWGPNNTPPSAVDTYLLASSTGCGSNTITFTNWWGDFFDPVTSTPDTNTKISEASCDVVISYANSPVSLLNFVGLAYDSEVVLQWVTGAEWDHSGFNVYRSLTYDDGYVQINADLVRNRFANMGPQGSYEFRDANVVNGRVYYYLIEDIATGGIKTKYGPVAVMPFAGLGSPPAIGGGVNIGDTEPGSDVGNGVNQGVIVNPGWQDLGHGIHILSQTTNSLRVEIIPPSVNYSPSAWNAAYEEVSIPGYAKSLIAGAPEILEKVVLIEVSDQFTDVYLTQEQITEGAVSSPHLLQPVPTYAIDSSNNLIPTYTVDAATYAINSLSPSTYYSVSPTTKEINGKRYIEITITPLRYNPVAQESQLLTKAVLDIGLGGQAWATTPSPGELVASPSAVPGVIRVRYDKLGMYELLFSDLVDLGIEGYYNGVGIADLRGYYHGHEIPLDIRSSDATFNTGDKIRFWGDFERNQDSVMSEVVITRIALGDSVGAALRYAPFDAAVNSWPATTQISTEARAEFEQDLIFLNDRPLGDFSDHFYWVRMGKWNSAQASYYPSSHTFNINLPGLMPDPSRKVYLNVDLRGRTQNAQNATHHLGVKLNSNPAQVGDVTFSDYYPTSVQLMLSASQFIEGNNQLTLEVLADTVPVNDWALLDIDRISVYYPSDKVASNGAKEIFKIGHDEMITVNGFSSNNITLYDLSDPDTARLFLNTSVTTSDGGLTYDLAFAVDSVNGADLGYRLYAIEDSAYLAPKEVFLNYGFENSLKDTQNGADLIIIGSKNMLEAASPLVAHRQADGLVVHSVDIEQVYAEFSNGIKSSVAIRDFLSFAYNYWAAKRPSYVLILGDASYDARNRLNLNSTGVEVMPLPMLSGDFVDFGSDNWYVTLSDEVVPKMALGRIPATNTLELEKYIEKLIAYESGARAPAAGRSHEYGFFSDADTLFEGFSKKSDQLSLAVTSVNSSSSSWNKSLSNYATSSDFTNEIVSQFNVAPLVVSFVGHGSEDRFGDNLINATQAKDLANTRLPIVLGLNCSTANFYEADTSVKYFGEEFVMNPKGGAIAYWGSTTYTVPETQVRLTQTFYEELSKETKLSYHKVRIGDLTLKSQVAIASQTSAKDSLRSWVLLGDPTMKIPQESFVGQNEESDDKGGGGGCGMVVPNQPPPNSGMWFILLLLPMCFNLWLRPKSTIG